MTNLIAIVTVCIVTNVTTASNESGCKMCSANPGCVPAVYHYGGSRPCAPYKEATEKTETTEVVEVKTLKFSWEGEEYTAKRERVLSRNVKRWKLAETWVQE
jgi:hypothetical protein